MSPSSCRSEVRCTSSVQNPPRTSCGAYYRFGIIVELLIDMLWCYTVPRLGDFANLLKIRVGQRDEMVDNSLGYYCYVN